MQRQRSTRGLALAALCFLAASLTSPFTLAQGQSQEQGEEPLIIEEGEQRRTENRSSGRSFFLNVGHFATGGDNSRSLSIVTTGFDFQTEKFQFYLEGKAWDETVEFTQELECVVNKNNNQGCLPTGLVSTRTDWHSDLEGEEDTRSLEVDTDEARLSEAYLAWSPVPQFTLSAGRRKIVWGQFDVFSPVSFNLPFTTKNIGTDFSKVNFILPQNVAQITIRPHERVEFQAYAFSDVRIDTLVSDFVETEYGIDRADLEDHDQTAARIIFYPDWATIALTYLDGKNTAGGNVVDERQTVVRVADRGDRQCIGDDGNALDTQPMPVTMPMGGMRMGQTFCLVEEDTALSDLEMYGLEVTIPRGNWNFKLELTHRRSNGDIQDLDVQRIADADPMGKDQNLSIANYLAWAVDNNQGQLYGDLTEDLGGFGFDYTGDKWRIEAAAFFYQRSYSGDGKDLADAIYMDDDDDDVEGAPFFNITRYMSDDRRSFIAFTAGFLGSIAYGGSLYGVWNIDPFLGGNLKLLAGMDVLQYRTDDQLSDLQEEVTASKMEGQIEMDELIARWDFDDEITVAPRIGLLWQF